MSSLDILKLNTGEVKEDIDVSLNKDDPNFADKINVLKSKISSKNYFFIRKINDNNQFYLELSYKSKVQGDNSESVTDLFFYFSDNPKDLTFQRFNSVFERYSLAIAKATILDLGKGIINLQVMFLTDSLLTFGDVCFNFEDNDKFGSGLYRLGYKGAQNKLIPYFNIKISGEDFFFIVNGVNYDELFDYHKFLDIEEKPHGTKESEPNEEDAIKENDRAQNANKAFSLISEDYIIPVEIKKDDKSIPKNKVYFKPFKITKCTPDKVFTALKLVKGKIRFKNTSNELVKEYASDKYLGWLDRQTYTSSSFSKSWQQYNVAHTRLLLDKLEDIGIIKVFNKSPQISSNETIEIYPNNVPSSLEVGDSLEILIDNEKQSNAHEWFVQCEEKIKDLLEIKNSFAANSDDLKFLDNFKSKFREITQAHTVGTFTVKKRTSQSIILRIPNNDVSFDFKNCILIYSLVGDILQIKRRDNAEKAIMGGTAPCRNLLHILAEDDQYFSENQSSNRASKGKKKKLKDEIKKKIFSHEPTLKQKEAIEVALNTPDIALIQGPPGTGKTTVITAIIHMLNSYKKHNETIKGSVLVSSLQHDAVENVIARLRVNSLPPIKFGDKRNSVSNLSEHLIEEWIDNIVCKVNQHFNGLTEEKVIHILDTNYNNYFSHPTNLNAKSLLENIKSLPSSVLVGNILTETNNILRSIRFSDNSENNERLAMIRRIRVNPRSFEDDGVKNISSILHHKLFKDLLSNEDKEFLDDYCFYSKDELKEKLKALENFRNEKILEFSPLPEYRVSKCRQDIVDLYQKVKKSLENHTKKSDDDLEREIVAKFVQEVSFDPVGIKKTIENYEFVFAATTQQSSSKEIADAKNVGNKKDGNNTSIKYDTVIIDEAARAMPLDLLIPMSQGNKIILVGDHRQLPHMLDEDVVNNLNKNKSDEMPNINKILKTSMFAILFERLKHLETVDGVKRTVTLDQQYRTHPVLGKFNSDHFYKPYGEAYGSPLPEQYFVQHLPVIDNRPMSWINVGYSEAEECKTRVDSSGSSYRTKEAKITAEYIAKWILSEQGKNLSFGIITFYKAQVNEILYALSEVGIAQNIGNNNYDIRDEYKYFENDRSKEKLRIGTVDAFQGMEFDVVILNMVRSQNPNYFAKLSPTAELHPAQIAKLYGFLISPNRMCVAMSRQKKALVIVGDSKLVSQSNIPNNNDYCAIRALKDFHHKCEEQGWVIYGK